MHAHCIVCMSEMYGSAETRHGTSDSHYIATNYAVGCAINTGRFIIHEPQNARLWLAPHFPRHVGRRPHRHAARHVGRHADVDTQKATQKWPNIGHIIYRYKPLKTRDYAADLLQLISCTVSKK